MMLLSTTSKACGPKEDPPPPLSSRTPSLLSSSSSSSLGQLNEEKKTTTKKKVPSSPLITAKDFLHVHKILGFTCLLSFMSRILWHFYNGGQVDMGFYNVDNNGTNNDWMTFVTLTVHALLSLSAFIFVVPSRRLKSGYQIWTEYRLHSVIFAFRSLFVMLVNHRHTVGSCTSTTDSTNCTRTSWDEHHGTALNLLIILGTMALADYVTATQKQQSSEGGFVRDLHGISPMIKFYFSCMQFAATAGCLVPVVSSSSSQQQPYYYRYTTQYVFLFIIQGNSFLMTLQRKNIFSRNVLIRLYGLALMVCFCIVLMEYWVFGGTALLCTVGLVCNTAILCRIILPLYFGNNCDCGTASIITAPSPRRRRTAEKYILWSILGLSVMVVGRPEHGTPAGPVLWTGFLLSESIILATAFMLCGTKDRRSIQRNEDQVKAVANAVVARPAEAAGSIAIGGRLATRQDFGSRMVYTHRYHCHPINFTIHFVTLPMQLLVFWCLPVFWSLPLSSSTSTKVLVTICALYYSSIEVFVASILSLQTYMVCQVAIAFDLDSNGEMALWAAGICLLSMLMLQLVVGHHGFQGGNPAFEAYDAFCVLPFYLWAQVLNYWCGHVAFTQELGIPSAPINAESAPDDNPAHMVAQRYRNYCGNGRVASVIIYFPANLPHLVTIVKRARQQSQKIRVIGKAHSYNASVTCCDEGQIIVRTELLRDISIDVESRTATVQAGVTVGELDHVLAEYQLCVPTNVILTSVTWGGIISTGSHGSGYAPMCDSVVSITLVDGRGNIRILERKRDGDAFRAAVLSLGTVGLIYEIRISVQPMTLLSLRDCNLPRIPTSTELLASAKLCDQFEVFTFGNFVFRREWHAMTSHPNVKPHVLANRLKRFIMKASGGFLWQVASWIMGWNFQAGYQLLSLASQGQSTTLFSRIGNRPDMIHFMDRIEDQPSYSTEFALRVADAPRAMEIAHEVRREFEASGRNPMFVITECRLTPPGKSLLQPRPRSDAMKEDKGGFNVDDKCEKWMAWVEILGTKAYDRDERFFVFAREWAQRVVSEFPHALPHWGKGFEALPQSVLRQLLARNYGHRLTTFEKERAEFDPEGVFLNAKLASLLTPSQKKKM